MGRNRHGNLFHLGNYPRLLDWRIRFGAIPLSILCRLSLCRAGDFLWKKRSFFKKEATRCRSLIRFEPFWLPPMRLSISAFWLPPMRPFVANYPGFAGIRWRFCFPAPLNYNPDVGIPCVKKDVIRMNVALLESVS